MTEPCSQPARDPSCNKNAYETSMCDKEVAALGGVQDIDLKIIEPQVGSVNSGHVIVLL